MTNTFDTDLTIFCDTLTQELGSPVTQTHIPGIHNTTFCSFQGEFFNPKSNATYLYTLQVFYHHDINHVPHGFSPKDIQVFGGECPCDTRDDKALLWLDRELSDDLKTHWGETIGEPSDPAEIARICADNIVQRSDHNALSRLIN